MKRLRIIILVLVAMVPMMLIAQNDWVKQVEDMMEQGEFKKAEAFMKSLPANVRTGQEVRIDSLNTIMGRIRKDFTMSPEEGLRQIKAKMPDVTAEQVAKWKRDRRIEYMVIDGK